MSSRLATESTNCKRHRLFRLIAPEMEAEVHPNSLRLDPVAGQKDHFPNARDTFGVVTIEGEVALLLTPRCVRSWGFYCLNSFNILLSGVVTDIHLVTKVFLVRKDVCFLRSASHVCRSYVLEILELDLVAVAS